MSASTRKNAKNRTSHDRSALIQWVALVLVAVLGIIAVVVLTESDGRGGGHSGAPAVSQSS